MTARKISSRAVNLEHCQFDESISPLLKRIYAGRGVTHQQQLELGLAELPPPHSLSGLSAALHLLTTALRARQSILVVGDFDADGATSTALAILALQAFGHRSVAFLVPNRFQYGYGLTPEIAELAAARHPDLLITVDNGISSHAGVAAARGLGMRVLITDHHLPGAELPEADAIINPQLASCEFPDKTLAGVGVIFYLMSALRSKLREDGWFKAESIAEPNMANWLDLVALGTVADLVPLRKTNRILVDQGLRRIRAGLCRPGIKALLEQANRDHRTLVAADLGFAVGPRLNAAGRLDDMTIGINCLLAEDIGTARPIACQLDELNRDRRSIEADMEREALAIVAALNLDEATLPWGLCLMDGQWHQGVVGLLASRVKDRFHRPVIAFAPGKDQELKGSARSIPGLHIRDVLDSIASQYPGMIDKFGGHAMAAGLSLHAAHFAEFAVAFDQQVRALLSAEELHAELVTDGVLDTHDFTLDVAEQLRNGGPWGQQFPEPSFYGKFAILDSRVVGERHLKLSLASDDDQVREQGLAAVPAIAFGVVQNGLVNSGGGDPHPVARLPERVSAVYRLDVNEYRGRRSVQLIIEHLMLGDAAGNGFEQSDNVSKTLI